MSCYLIVFFILNSVCGLGIYLLHISWFTDRIYFLNALHSSGMHYYRIHMLTVINLVLQHLSGNFYLHLQVGSTEINVKLHLLI